MSTEAIEAAPLVTKPASPPPDLSRCGLRVRRVASDLGLERAHLVQLIGDPTSAQVEALDALLGAGHCAGLTATREVLVKLEDRLGLDLGSRELCSQTARIGRRVADVIGAVLGITCGYVVIGGLLEGESLMLGNSIGPMGLPLFFSVLTLLAAFEALHVSAAMLKIADLGAIAAQHPRAAALHRRFHTDEGLARFLAGRQLVVVGTVFLCSSLSSFPNMTELPFTSIAVPAV